ncbi:putative ankyrin repeat protein [Acanthamoeba polyphaga mimivirus]|uniref:Ankyrin repeat protein n=1 Tax=Acanthamoeba polyphaga mimivirus Kroon TaxID=3069720 RepID=A0A0G2Y241_9VIRU|nr:putative ankyrin repeat protein [Acanthamoeba polyphaga mimivirus]AKI79798.1 putative ankyrin repeat protein [Acanthamoeba polyphaga mimivirus Kroon]
MYLIISEKNSINGHKNIISHLSKKNRRKKINSQNEKGWTALMIASAMSNDWSSIDTVKLLLKYGADVNIKNNSGMTALMLSSNNSATYSSDETVELLINNGANINNKDEDGWTPLMFVVCENTKSQISTIKLLLKYGADIYCESINKKNCIHLICLKEDGEDDYETLELLINQGLDVNSLNSLGETPLSVLCSKNNKKYGIDLINYFIEKGADIHIPDTYGKTAFMYACKYSITFNDISIVELLLSKGCDINLVASNNFSALKSACYYLDKYCSIEIVKFLVEKGANIEPICEKECDHLYCTALLVACFRSKYYNNLEVINYLLDNGANINRQNSKGYTPLMLVCKKNSGKNSEQLIKLLINRGADTSICSKSKKTILMIACKYKSSKAILEIILQSRKIDINARDKNGKTALMMVCSRSYNISMMKLLLENGANPNTQTNNGSTALDLSIDDLDKMKLLFRYGVDILIPNDRGQTFLKRASTLFNCYKIQIAFLIAEYGFTIKINDTHKKYLFDRYETVSDIMKLNKLHECAFKSKIIMDLIIGLIPDKVENFLLSPHSLRVRLLKLQWSLKSGDMSKVITFDNLELLDYLSITCLDDLDDKLTDILKYLY